MALLCATMLVFAQTSTQTALLKHGNNITSYYGADAFIEAHAAATAGDIITLSSGTFNAPDITKAITLRGVGCVSDAEQNLQPTSITGTVITNITDTINHLTVEGIYFDYVFSFDSLIDPVFIRCNFEKIQWHRDTWTTLMRNPQFINCRMRYFNTYRIDNITLQNCIIWDFRNGFNAGWAYEHIYAYNSYLNLANSFHNLYTYNSIVIGDRNGMCAQSVAYHTIGIGEIFLLCSNYNCWNFDNYDEVFESFTGEDYVWTTEPLLLKNAIANQCLGQDGTQVGIYGGNMPYSARPTYMMPYRATVGQHSTPEGKLNIHIEVVE